MLISKHFLCRVVGTVKGQSTLSLHPQHFGYFQHAGHGGKETVEGGGEGGGEEAVEVEEEGGETGEEV